MLRQITAHGRQQPKQGLGSAAHHALAPPSRQGPSVGAFSTASAARDSYRGSSRRHRGPTPARKAKAQPDWKVRQQELGEQIRSLEQRVIRLDKRQEAQEAAEDLPELDDALLDQLYAGVQEEPPLSPEENRLLLTDEQRKLQRYARAIETSTRLLPGAERPLLAEPGSSVAALSGQEDPSASAPPTFSERMELRLQALAQGLWQIQQQSQKEGQPSTSTAQRDLDELNSQVDILKDMLATVKVEEHSATAIDAEGNVPSDDVDPADVGSEDTSQYTEFDTLNFPADGQAEPSAPQASPSPHDGVEGASDTLESQAVRATHDESPAAPSEPPRNLDHLVGLIEAATKAQTDGPGMLGLVSKEEWSALGFASASHETDDLLQRTSAMLLALSKEAESGARTVESENVVAFHNAVADAFASRGDVDGTKSVVALLLENGFPVDNYAQHCLVKSYLKQDPTNAAGGITSALSIINSLEEAGEPAAQATYSLTLSALLDAPDIETKDEAWGLWYRMRLNAYPTPDAVVWSNMLRACALGSMPARNTGLALQEAHRGAAWSRPKQTVSELRGKRTHRGEAETALDLFKEMTLVEGIRPNPACYDHLILACCRGHDTASYLEGFRLLSEMISTADEMNLSAYEPTRTTYNALLEGCKLNKDLLRARWVLAEMIRSSAALWSPSGEQAKLSWQQRAQLIARMPDAETLGKVFFTYAAWKPPTKRIVSKKSQSGEKTGKSVQQDDAASFTTKDVTPTRASESTAATPRQSFQALSQPEMDEAATSFSSALPSTSAEVVREVRGLLARVILDRMDSPQDHIRGPMSCVAPSARLLNAYLSVLKAHQPAAQILATFSSAVEDPEKSLFAKMGLRPNAHTYLLVLETCSAHAKQQEAGTRLSDWAWGQWRELETKALTGRLDSEDGPVSASTIAGIWSARIAFLTRAKPLDEAVCALREFIALYPPTPKRDGQSSEVTRKMPYFDFKSIKAELEMKEAKNRHRMKQLIQRLQQSWKQVGQDVRLLPNGDDSWLRLEIEDANQQMGKEVEVQRQDTSESTNHVTTADSSASAAAKTFRSIFHPRPPSLTFFDLNVLHQRLKTTSTAARPTRDAELKLIAWACKVWESRERVDSK